MSEGFDEANQDEPLKTSVSPESLIRLTRPGTTTYILGGPGSGKTLMCHAIAAAACKEEVALIPVWMDARLLDVAQTRTELIRGALLDSYLLSDSDLQAIGEMGRFLFIIDGLNEIEYATSDDGIKRLMKGIVRGGERSGVIATSRMPIPSGFDIYGPMGRHCSRIVLHQFSRDQMLELVSRHSSLDRESFDRYLREGNLHGLVSNPQLLAMLIDIVSVTPRPDAGSIPPMCLSDIFDRFFEAKWHEKGHLVGGASLGLKSFRLAVATLAWHLKLKRTLALAESEWNSLLQPFDSILLYGLMEIPRMSCRHRSRRDDSALCERLVELAREKPRFGYRRLHVLLCRDEPEARINHERVWLVYHDLGLSVRRTRRKRLTHVLRPRSMLTAPNQEWAIDFASDVTAGGRRLDFQRCGLLYARVSDAGGGHVHTQPPRDQSIGRDYGHARSACGDSER